MERMAGDISHKLVVLDCWYHFTTQRHHPIRMERLYIILTMYADSIFTYFYEAGLISPTHKYNNNSAVTHGTKISVISAIQKLWKLVISVWIMACRIAGDQLFQYPNRSTFQRTISPLLLMSHIAQFCRYSLQWRHDEHDGVSNHPRLDC